MATTEVDTAEALPLTTMQQMEVEDKESLTAEYDDKDDQLSKDELKKIEIELTKALETAEQSGDGDAETRQIQNDAVVRNFDVGAPEHFGVSESVFFVKSPEVADERTCTESHVDAVNAEKDELHVNGKLEELEEAGNVEKEMETLKEKVEAVPCPDNVDKGHEQVPGAAGQTPNESVEVSDHILEVHKVIDTQAVAKESLYESEKELSVPVKEIEEELEKTLDSEAGEISIPESQAEVFEEPESVLIDPHEDKNLEANKLQEAEESIKEDPSASKTEKDDTERERPEDSIHIQAEETEEELEQAISLKDDPEVEKLERSWDIISEKKEEAKPSDIADEIIRDVEEENTIIEQHTKEIDTNFNDTDTTPLPLEETENAEVENPIKECSTTTQTILSESKKIDEISTARHERLAEDESVPKTEEENDKESLAEITEMIAIGQIGIEEGTGVQAIADSSEVDISPEDSFTKAVDEQTYEEKKEEASKTSNIEQLLQEEEENKSEKRDAMTEEANDEPESSNTDSSVEEKTNVVGHLSTESLEEDVIAVSLDDQKEDSNKKEISDQVITKVSEIKEEPEKSTSENDKPEIRVPESSSNSTSEIPGEVVASDDADGIRITTTEAETDKIEEQDIGTIEYKTSDIQSAREMNIPLTETSENTGVAGAEITDKDALEKIMELEKPHDIDSTQTCKDEDVETNKEENIEISEKDDTKNSLLTVTADDSSSQLPLPVESNKKESLLDDEKTVQIDETPEIVELVPVVTPAEIKEDAPGKDEEKSASLSVEEPVETVAHIVETDKEDPTSVCESVTLVSRGDASADFSDATEEAVITDAGQHLQEEEKQDEDEQSATMGEEAAEKDDNKEKDDSPIRHPSEKTESEEGKIIDKIVEESVVEDGTKLDEFIESESGIQTHGTAEVSTQVEQIEETSSLDRMENKIEKSLEEVAEPDPDNLENLEKVFKSEPDPDDSEKLKKVSEPDLDYSENLEKVSEPDPDATQKLKKVFEPGLDDSENLEQISEPQWDDSENLKKVSEPDPDHSENLNNISESDPDDSEKLENIVEPNRDDTENLKNVSQPDPEDNENLKNVSEPDPDDTENQEKVDKIEIPDHSTVSRSVEVITATDTAPELSAEDSVHEEDISSQIPELRNEEEYQPTTIVTSQTTPAPIIENDIEHVEETVSIVLHKDVEAEILDKDAEEKEIVSTDQIPIETHYGVTDDAGKVIILEEKKDDVPATSNIMDSSPAVNIYEKDETEVLTSEKTMELEKPHDIDSTQTCKVEDVETNKEENIEISEKDDNKNSLLTVTADDSSSQLPLPVESYKKESLLDDEKTVQIDETPEIVELVPVVTPAEIKEDAPGKDEDISGNVSVEEPVENVAHIVETDKEDPTSVCESVTLVSRGDASADFSDATEKAVITDAVQHLQEEEKQDEDEQSATMGEAAAEKDDNKEKDARIEDSPIHHPSEKTESEEGKIIDKIVEESAVEDGTKLHELVESDSGIQTHGTEEVATQIQHIEETSSPDQMENKVEKSLEVVAELDPDDSENLEKVSEPDPDDTEKFKQVSESVPDDSEKVKQVSENLEQISEAQPDDSETEVLKKLSQSDSYETDNLDVSQNLKNVSEPNPDDTENLKKVSEQDLDDTEKLENIAEPNHDESENLKNVSEPDPDDTENQENADKTEIPEDSTVSRIEVITDTAPELSAEDSVHEEDISSQIPELRNEEESEPQEPIIEHVEETVSIVLNKDDKEEIQTSQASEEHISKEEEGAGLSLFSVEDSKPYEDSVKNEEEIENVAANVNTKDSEIPVTVAEGDQTHVQEVKEQDGEAVEEEELENFPNEAEEPEPPASSINDDEVTNLESKEAPGKVLDHGSVTEKITVSEVLVKADDQGEEIEHLASKAEETELDTSSVKDENIISLKSAEVTGEIAEEQQKNDVSVEKEENPKEVPVPEDEQEVNTNVQNETEDTELSTYSDLPKEEEEPEAVPEDNEPSPSSLTNVEEKYTTDEVVVLEDKQAQPNQLPNELEDDVTSASNLNNEDTTILKLEEGPEEVQEKLSVENQPEEDDNVTENKIAKEEVAQHDEQGEESVHLPNEAEDTEIQIPASTVIDDDNFSALKAEEVPEEEKEKNDKENDTVQEIETGTEVIVQEDEQGEQLNHLQSVDEETESSAPGVNNDGIDIPKNDVGPEIVLEIDQAKDENAKETETINEGVVQESKGVELEQLPTESGEAEPSGGDERTTVLKSQEEPEEILHEEKKPDSVKDDTEEKENEKETMGQENEQGQLGHLSDETEILEAAVEYTNDRNQTSLKGEEALEEDESKNDHTEVDEVKEKENLNRGLVLEDDDQREDAKDEPSTSLGNDEEVTTLKTEKNPEEVLEQKETKQAEDDSDTKMYETANEALVQGTPLENENDLPNKIVEAETSAATASVDETVILRGEEDLEEAEEEGKKKDQETETANELSVKEDKKGDQFEHLPTETKDTELYASSVSNDKVTSLDSGEKTDAEESKQCSQENKDVTKETDPSNEYLRSSFEELEAESTESKNKLESKEIESVKDNANKEDSTMDDGSSPCILEDKVEASILENEQTNSIDEEIETTGETEIIDELHETSVEKDNDEDVTVSEALPTAEDKSSDEDKKGLTETETHEGDKLESLASVEVLNSEVQKGFIETAKEIEEETLENVIPLAGEENKKDLTYAETQGEKLQGSEGSEVLIEGDENQYNEFLTTKTEEKNLPTLETVEVPTPTADDQVDMTPKETMDEVPQESPVLQEADNLDDEEQKKLTNSETGSDEFTEKIDTPSESSESSSILREEKSLQKEDIETTIPNEISLVENVEKTEGIAEKEPQAKVETHFEADTSAGSTLVEPVEIPSLVLDKDDEINQEHEGVGNLGTIKKKSSLGPEDATLALSEVPVNEEVPDESAIPLESGSKVEQITKEEIIIAKTHSNSTDEASVNEEKKLEPLSVESPKELNVAEVVDIKEVLQMQEASLVSTPLQNELEKQKGQEKYIENITSVTHEAEPEEDNKTEEQHDESSSQLMIEPMKLQELAANDATVVDEKIEEITNIELDQEETKGPSETQIEIPSNSSEEVDIKEVQVQKKVTVSPDDETLAIDQFIKSEVSDKIPEETEGSAAPPQVSTMEVYIMEGQQVNEAQIEELTKELPEDKLEETKETQATEGEIKNKSIQDLNTADIKGNKLEEHDLDEADGSNTNHAAAIVNLTDRDATLVDETPSEQVELSGIPLDKLNKIILETRESEEATEESKPVECISKAEGTTCKDQIVLAEKMDDTKPSSETKIPINTGGNKDGDLQDQELVTLQNKTSIVQAENNDSNLSIPQLEQNSNEAASEEIIHAEVNPKNDPAAPVSTRIMDIPAENSLSDLLQISTKDTIQMTQEPNQETNPTPKKEDHPPEDPRTDDDEEDEEHKKTDSSSDGVIVEASRDMDIKSPQKKHHGILSGVGSKVKHSISKVKKAITGKSSHPKPPSPK